jgi:type III restriction enzyme
VKFTLLPFQETTVDDLVSEVRYSMDEVARGGRDQAVVLVAPTGAGKTVMAAGALESLFFGDGQSVGADDDLTVVWLSDLPNVNEQTRKKLDAASERFTSRLIMLDNNFRGDQLPPGQIYFLNTQKLRADSHLVTSGDDRSTNIWEVLSRTIRRDPAKFLLVIDEAHRGMERAGTASADAATLVQRFVLGFEEMPQTPIIIGISATPERFDAVLASTQRVVRRATAQVADVRASGLLKDRIVVWRPEHGLEHSDMTLLQRAAQSLLDYQVRWNRHSTNHGTREVRPVMVVQVEDKTSAAISATDLEQAIEAIEEVTGVLSPDAYAHSFGDAPAAINLKTRRLRYIRPADIDDDPELTVVFFKTSLSTGWDCPRAEVIMSFRGAQDDTAIAQLVGRLVRTPLAKRIDADDALNSVALYLPKYDRGALQRIIAKLRAGDPDTLPAVEVEEGDSQVLCDLDEDAADQVRASLDRIVSYVVPRPKRMPPVLRVEALAGALSDVGIMESAPDDVDTRLVELAWSRLETRRGSREFEQAVQRSREVGLDATTLSYLTGAVETQTLRVESTSRSLERLYDQVGRATGAALHDKLWRRIRRGGVDGDTARLYVIATLGDGATQRALQDEATQMFDDWMGEHEDAVDDLGDDERLEIDQLREHADAPSKTKMVLVDSIRSRRDSRTVDWPRHLYLDEDDVYPDRLNTWETDAIEHAIADKNTICWLRNRPRGRGSLAIPYNQSATQVAAMYPDFLVFRNSGGQVLVDLVDPHGLHLDDAPAKAKGLADYAQKHGSTFARIILVVYDKDQNRHVSLDLRRSDIRNQVQSVTTKAHLLSLFSLAGKS